MTVSPAKSNPPKPPSSDETPWIVLRSAVDALLDAGFGMDRIKGEVAKMENDQNTYAVVAVNPTAHGSVSVEVLSHWRDMDSAVGARRREKDRSPYHERLHVITIPKMKEG